MVKNLPPLGWCGRKPLRGTFHWRVGEGLLRGDISWDLNWQVSHANISITHPCHLIMFPAYLPSLFPWVPKVCSVPNCLQTLGFYSTTPWLMLFFLSPVTQYWPVWPHPRVQNENLLRMLATDIRKQGADQSTGTSLLPDQTASVSSCGLPIHSVTGEFQ